MRYTAWGEVRYTWGSTFTNYTYTGQYSNVPDFGLMYYNARWYDPGLGRFAQADSIIPLESQGVQAWDRYAGMNNNPVRYSDPSGHDVGCGGRYDGQNCKPTQTVKPKTPTQTLIGPPNPKRYFLGSFYIPPAEPPEVEDDGDANISNKAEWLA